MNWLGTFTSADAAASLLAAGGIPAVMQLGPDGKSAAMPASQTISFYTPG